MQLLSINGLGLAVDAKTFNKLEIRTGFLSSACEAIESVFEPLTPVRELLPPLHNLMYRTD